jgi:hypothetical protein
MENMLLLFPEDNNIAEPKLILSIKNKVFYRTIYKGKEETKPATEKLTS